MLRLRELGRTRDRPPPFCLSGGEHRAGKTLPPDSSGLVGGGCGRATDVALLGVGTVQRPAPLADVCVRGLRLLVLGLAGLAWRSAGRGYADIVSLHACKRRSGTDHYAVCDFMRIGAVPDTHVLHALLTRRHRYHSLLLRSILRVRYGYDQAIILFISF